MGKTGIKPGNETQNSFFRIKTYSISEIQAAGGATAFATQIGKDPGKLESRLKDVPKEDFLTEAESESALVALRNNK